MSDVKFEGESVVVEGSWTRLRTMDLMLDSPSRRKVAGGERRALVHDHDDGLTLNWANDYPGGVTINAARVIRGRNNKDWIDLESRIARILGSDLMLDSAGRRSNTTPYRRALVHDFNDGLTLNWANDYPGGVTINGPVRLTGEVTINGNAVLTAVKSLVETIDSLSLKATRLEARVAELERK